jgi:dethiobiotin synthetase
MKPVAAGAALTAHGWRNADALDLAAAGSVRLPYQLTNPVCLPEATSPHLAAARAGTPIDVDAILAAFRAIQAHTDVIVVEGAGGWLAPVGAPGPAGRPGPTMQDIALALQLPVVLVVGVRLGCLSHALLTEAAILASGLPLAGWIANRIDPDFADTDCYVQSLEERLACPLLWNAPRVILPSQ